MMGARNFRNNWNPQSAIRSLSGHVWLAWLSLRIKRILNRKLMFKWDTDRRKKVNIMSETKNRKMYLAKFKAKAGGRMG